MRKLKIITLVAFVILGAMGVVFLFYTRKYAEKAASEQALLIAQTAQAAMPTDLLNNLDFDLSDLQKPNYVDLKKTLAHIRDTDNKVRFTYITAMKSNKIYIIADSEPESSLDYSPPGQEYTEASNELFGVFKDGRALVTKPQTDRWGTWVSALIPIKDAAGKVVAVFGMDYPDRYWTNQITKQSMEALLVIVAIYATLVAFLLSIRETLSAKETGRNYRSFFETIDDIVLICDGHGKFYYANQAAHRRLGYTAKEFEELNILQLRPRDRQEEARIFMGEVLAGKRDSCDIPLLKKGGITINMETKVWIGTWSGRSCIFSISKDVGKEQELLQKFTKIFDSHPDMMVLSSLPDNKFTDVNQAFLNKLGYEKNYVIGKTALDLGIFADPSSQEIISSELIKKGSVHNIELALKNGSGKDINCIYSGETIDIQGRMFLLTIMLDETEERRVKKELVQRNQDLEAVNKIMINRELKMVELKQEIARLQGLAHST